MANFDLILLALIAVFIFLRLRSVLGERDGNEENRNHYDQFNQEPSNDEVVRKEEHDNVIHLPGAQNEQQDMYQQQPADTVKQVEPETSAQRGLAEIMAVDPTFEPQGFLQGARGAFEMVIGAFAKDDREILKNLLSEEVNENFVSALDARKAAGETMDHTLIGVTSMEVVEAGLEGSQASVTVKIVSEQVNVTMDSDGEVVDGDSNYIDTITDIWTFERDTASQGPNWYLTATDTE